MFRSIMSLMTVSPPEILNKFHESLKTSSPCLSWYSNPRLRLVHLGDLIDNEKLERNFEQILRFIQLGFPVKVFKQDWFPGLICIPLFHCYQCLDVWAATDRVPTTCAVEARDVHGPMITISMTKYNQLFALLRKDWNQERVRPDKTARKSADQSIRGSGRQSESNLRSSILRSECKNSVRVAEFTDIDDLVRKYRKKFSPKTVSVENLTNGEKSGKIVRFQAGFLKEPGTDKERCCCGRKNDGDGQGKVQDPGRKESKDKITKSERGVEVESEKKEKGMANKEEVGEWKTGRLRKGGKVPSSELDVRNEMNVGESQGFEKAQQETAIERQMELMNGQERREKESQDRRTTYEETKTVDSTLNLTWFNSSDKKYSLVDLKIKDEDTNRNNRTGEKRTVYKRKEKSLKKRTEQFGESSATFERPLRKPATRPVSQNKKTIYHPLKEEYSPEDMVNDDNSTTPQPSRRTIQIILPFVKNDEHVEKSKNRRASFVSPSQAKLKKIRVEAEALPKVVRSTSKICIPSSDDVVPGSPLPNIKVEAPEEDSVEGLDEVCDNFTVESCMEPVNVKTFELELTRAFKFSYFPWLARRH